MSQALQPPRLLSTGHDDAPLRIALTMDDLRERGIQMPGQMVYELELDGYPVDRVHRRSIVGHRLGAPAEAARDHANPRRDA